MSLPTSELLGKTVRVAITCVSQEGAEIDRFQTFGTIETVTERWIGIRRVGLSELFGLPPVPEVLEPTGENADSDYTAELRVTVADTESLLVLRGTGFSPG